MSARPVAAGLTPAWSSSDANVYAGDCLDVLRALPDASVDSVVTDPPYGLSNTTPGLVVDTLTRWVTGDREHVPDVAGFMGRRWDAFVPPPAVWDECLRVLKPGGHLLAFAGSRTADLMTLSIRLAGFEIRDSIAWLYGNGVPKSLDASEAMAAFLVDMLAATERPADWGSGDGKAHPFLSTLKKNTDGTPKKNPDGTPVGGWGTALKPAFEPVVVARKPLAGTVAATVLKYGTGALNIDACRVPTSAAERERMAASAESFFKMSERVGQKRPDGSTRKYATVYGKFGNFQTPTPPHEAGRWPTNVVLDGHTATELDRQAPDTGGAAPASYGARGGLDGAPAFYGARGGASRFFPVFRWEAKAPSSQRPRLPDGTVHPTVKPLDLMRWLIRLVTPPGGVVLEPFAGSGTTVEAALVEGFECIGIERDPDYLPLIAARLSKPLQPVLGFGIGDAS